jgi:hypothetical protein
MGVCCSKDKVLDSHAMSQVWGCLNPDFFLCLLRPSPLTKSEFYECRKYQELIICQKSKLSEHLCIIRYTLGVMFYSVVASTSGMDSFTLDRPEES